MLQQTRVAAVIPYYERFLARFPTVEALAQAREETVLTLWAGLGYYSRARNLQRAARQVMELGRFPNDYVGLRALAGVGDYTAAAVASIAFGLPHAVVDGNVRRVVMRLSGSASADEAEAATLLLDRKRPGDWNQALMELGAVVCTPRDPQCGSCPISGHCLALRHDTVLQLPPKRVRGEKQFKQRRLLLIEQNGRILLTASPRVEGFWDLPEPGLALASGVSLGKKLGTFRHTITNSQYVFDVYRATVQSAPRNHRWWSTKKLQEIPLSTTAKKALRCLETGRIEIR
jgi:A/G-specific adenine glycosylase